MAFTIVISRWKSKLCVGNSSVVKRYINGCWRTVKPLSREVDWDNRFSPCVSFYDVSNCFVSWRSSRIYYRRKTCRCRGKGQQEWMFKTLVRVFKLISDFYFQIRNLCYFLSHHDPFSPDERWEIMDQIKYSS